MIRACLSAPECPAIRTNSPRLWLISPRASVSLIRPPRSKFAFTHIHGLRWQDVEAEPTFGTVWTGIEPMLEGADFLARIADEEGVRLGVLDRGRHAVAYAKGIETIADTLALAGASRTVLLFEERAVISATRSRANRLANADHANLVRTSRAAHDQLQAVERLRRSGELARLPARLQEIAELRERHPTLPLRELALKCRPPATKASAHRRLRKLQELASI